MPDVIPSRDADAALFMDAMAITIAQDHASYWFSEQDAARISEEVDSFVAAYKRVRIGNRTKYDLAVKNNARKRAEHVCRQAAAAIKANWSIDPDRVTALGFRPRTRHPALDRMPPMPIVPQRIFQLPRPEVRWRPDRSRTTSFIKD